MVAFPHETPHVKYFQSGKGSRQTSRLRSRSSIQGSSTNHDGLATNKGKKEEPFEIVLRTRDILGEKLIGHISQWMRTASKISASSAMTLSDVVNININCNVN